jgi:pimeloyl-ACP methyl ester carboxylesterase
MSLFKNYYPPEKPADINIFKYENVDIAYKYTVNDSQAETLLLFYGFDGSIQQMDVFIPHFTEFNVLIIDYPGHCYSSLPLNDEHTDFKFYTNAIKQIVNYLKIDSLYLLGYSFGGIAALDYYLKDKVKVKKIVFLNALFNFRYNTFKKIFYWFFEKLIAWNFDFIIPYFAVPLLIDKYFDKELLKTSQRISLCNDKNSVLQTFHKTITANLEGELSVIESPIMLLGSKNDILADVSKIKKNAEQIRNCKLHIFPAYGHVSFASCPALIAGFITDFFKE